ncbi:MAG TPA: hypothetical protein VF172_13595 [Nitrososphaera sp.]
MERLYKNAQRISRPENHPRYIDNLAEFMNISLHLSIVELEWKENGQSKWITIPLENFSGIAHRRRLSIPNVYPDRNSAMAAIAPLLSAHAKVSRFRDDPPIMYTYYEGPHDTILPTIFSPHSTPRLFSAFADLKIDIEEAKRMAGSQSMINIYQTLFDYFNPVPGIAVDPHGKIVADIDAGSLIEAGLAAIGLKAKMRGKSRDTRGHPKDTAPVKQTTTKRQYRYEGLEAAVLGNMKAEKAIHRLDNMGYGKLLEDIADRFEGAPRDAAELLIEINNLSKRQLDGLYAMRNALTKHDWIDDFYDVFPKADRNEVLDLIGEVSDVLHQGLEEGLTRLLSRPGAPRAGTVSTNIQSGLGHFSCCCVFEEKIAAQKR